ncbi:hypothetical protein VCHENC02_0589A, partial [Vibrio harveyi]
MVDLGSQIQ